MCRSTPQWIPCVPHPVSATWSAASASRYRRSIRTDLAFSAPTSHELLAGKFPARPAPLVLRAAHPCARGGDEPGVLGMGLAAAERCGGEHRRARGVFGIAHRLVADQLNLRLARQGGERLRALVAHAVRPH